MPTPKMRLNDLESLSKKNTEAREKCLRALSALPIPAKAMEIRKVTEAFPPLLDEIIEAGARILTATLREPPKPLAVLVQARNERKERQARVAGIASEVVRRVEAGAAAVELLDSVLINGKKLGDCTGQELATEADAESRRATVLSVHADWLRRLASVIGPNETVRTADRQAVIGVLSSRGG